MCISARKIMALVEKFRSSPNSFLVALICLASTIQISYQVVGEMRKFGHECIDNPPILDPKSGKGHVEMLGGLNAYVSGSPLSMGAILLASDVYGYEASNLRKLADKVANAGYLAVVPDFFQGDPFVPGKRPQEEWLKDHLPENAFGNATLVLEALKPKGVSLIGAAGFCWGGKLVAMLAGTPFIKAAVLLHLTYVNETDIEGVKAPILMLGAELDKLTPPEVLKKFEKILKEKPEVPSSLEIVPGVGHGWTVR